MAQKIRFFAKNIEKPCIYEKKVVTLHANCNDITILHENNLKIYVYEIQCIEFQTLFAITGSKPCD